MRTVTRFKRRADFNIEFDTLARHLRSRLETRNLDAELRADSTFIGTAGKLHCDAVHESLQGQCVAFDGLEIVTAIPLDGLGVRLDFRFHYLDGPHGYSVGPSRFVLVTDKHVAAGASAIFECGLTPPDGSFWYPPSSKTRDWFMPPTEYNWAFERRRLIDSPSLFQWRAAKKNE